MAEFVGAFGVPHTPGFPALVEREGQSSETAQLYQAILDQLLDLRVDVLVVFDSDHLNSFFLDNLPALCIPVAADARGPNDSVPSLPERLVRLQPQLGMHMVDYLTRGQFDVSRSHHLSLDHSLMVPLHFLDPENRFQVLPIYINGLVPPVISSLRAHSLGECVLKTIAEWDSESRVAIIASGSFSLEVGGPRISDDGISGVPDPEWVLHVADRLKKGAISKLIDEATTERMLRAGNVGGELLNWIALLGTVGDKPCRFLELQTQFGHGYASWGVL